MGVETKRGFVKVAVSRAVARLRVSTRRASAFFFILFPSSSSTWLLEHGRLRECENTEFI